MVIRDELKDRDPIMTRAHPLPSSNILFLGLGLGGTWAWRHGGDFAIIHKPGKKDTRSNNPWGGFVRPEHEFVG